MKAGLEELGYEIGDALKDVASSIDPSVEMNGSPDVKPREGGSLAVYLKGREDVEFIGVQLHVTWDPVPRYHVDFGSLRMRHGDEINFLRDAEGGTLFDDFDRVAEPIAHALKQNL